MNEWETIRAQQAERDAYYAERYPDPTVHKFAEFIGHHRVCPECWAVMVDPAKHEQWHRDLTEQ